MNGPRSDRPEAGFTIIEIVVVMGLLASFALMLVQLTGSGVEMFTKGQRGQDLSDRAMLAAHAIEQELERMIGPPRLAYEPQEPDARLIVTYENAGFVRDEDALRTQVVRATVGLTDDEEVDLLRVPIRRAILDELGDIDEVALETLMAEELARTPRFGRGDMLLLPWPADDDGVFFELRRGVFTKDPDTIPVMYEQDFGGETFPASLVEHVTEVIATGLLHVEFAWWSPETNSWGAQTGFGGPEFVWDSARAGLFEELAEGAPRTEDFPLDLGPDSLRDLRDDVFPRWVRVTLVVARSANEPPEAFLAEPIDDESKKMVLTRIDRLPKPSESRFLKVGAEWVRYDDTRGVTVTGLRRGLRGTRATPHKVGVSVRAGRTISFYQRIEHGREGS